MITEIQCATPSGVLGGWKGLIVDLNSKTIEWSYGYTENISPSNIKDVEWCIQQNIYERLERLNKNIKKTKQTEVIKTEIENGVRISEPLTEAQQKHYQDRIDTIISEINELSAISIIDLLTESTYETN